MLFRGERSRLFRPISSPYSLENVFLDFVTFESYDFSASLQTLTASRKLFFDHVFLLFEFVLSLSPVQIELRCWNLVRGFSRRDKYIFSGFYLFIAKFTCTLKSFELNGTSFLSLTIHKGAKVIFQKFSNNKKLHTTKIWNLLQFNSDQQGNLPNCQAPIWTKLD